MLKKASRRKLKLVFFLSLILGFYFLSNVSAIAPCRESHEYRIFSGSDESAVGQQCSQACTLETMCPGWDSMREDPYAFPLYPENCAVRWDNNLGQYQTACRVVCEKYSGCGKCCQPTSSYSACEVPNDICEISYSFGIIFSTENPNYFSCILSNLPVTNEIRCFPGYVNSTKCEEFCCGGIETDVWYKPQDNQTCCSDGKEGNESYVCQNNNGCCGGLCYDVYNQTCWNDGPVNNESNGYYVCNNDKKGCGGICIKQDQICCGDGTNPKSYGCEKDEKCNKGNCAQDKDKDGYFDLGTGGIGGGGGGGGDNDCNDNDPIIYPGAIELCDNKDNDCDGTVDEGCSCNNNPPRTCGMTDIGDCEYGWQYCENNIWGECVGAIYPQTETCEDTTDKNCDGKIKEDCPCALDSDCNQDNLCMTGACVNETCQVAPKNCDDNNLCTQDSCDPNIGCINTPGNSSKIKKVTITPDYFLDFKDKTVKYSDIFPTQMVCKAEVENGGSISYKISGLSYYEGIYETTSGNIPDEYVKPGDNINCKANATNSCGSDFASDDNRVPNYNVFSVSDDFQLINVLENMPIIVNKPLMARIPVYFQSDLINVSDEYTTINFYFNNYVNQFYVLPKVWDLLYYLKQDEEKNFGKLLEIKRGQNTYNIFNVPAPISGGSYNTKINISDDLKESDYEDNILEKNILSRQQTRTLKIGFAFVQVLYGHDETFDIYSVDANAIATREEYYRKILQLYPFEKNKFVMDNHLYYISLDSPEPVGREHYDNNLKLRNEAFVKLDEIAEKNKLDFIIGIAPEGMMFDSGGSLKGLSKNNGWWGIGSYPRVALVADYTWGNDYNTANHELGHLSGLYLGAEEYSIENPFGYLSGNGWSLDPYTGNDGGARINVWDVKGFDNQYESRDRNSQAGISHALGEHYFDFMGDSMDLRAWVNPDTYTNLINQYTK